MGSTCKYLFSPERVFALSEGDYFDNYAFLARQHREPPVFTELRAKRVSAELSLMTNDLNRPLGKTQVDEYLQTILSVLALG